MDTCQFRCCPLLIASLFCKLVRLALLPPAASPVWLLWHKLFRADPCNTCFGCDRYRHASIRRVDVIEISLFSGSEPCTEEVSMTSNQNPRWRPRKITAFGRRIAVMPACWLRSEMLVNQRGACCILAAVALLYHPSSLAIVPFNGARCLTCTCR